VVTPDAARARDGRGETAARHATSHMSTPAGGCRQATPSGRTKGPERRARNEARNRGFVPRRAVPASQPGAFVECSENSGIPSHGRIAPTSTASGASSARPRQRRSASPQNGRGMPEPQETSEYPRPPVVVVRRHRAATSVATGSSGRSAAATPAQTNKRKEGQCRRSPATQKSKRKAGDEEHQRGPRTTPDRAIGDMSTEPVDAHSRGARERPRRDR